MLQCGIMHLSPLSSSKKIDSARSRSGLFFARRRHTVPVGYAVVRFSGAGVTRARRPDAFEHDFT